MNSVEQKGYTPLDRAVAEGHDEVAALLRAAGGLESMSSTSRALYDAVDSDDGAKVQRLLDANACPNWVNPANGRVALHKAAKQGLVKIVQVLLAHTGEKVDVNVQEIKGQTPLDRALAEGHEEVADLLRAAGAKSGGDIPSTVASPPAPESANADSEGTTKATVTLNPRPSIMVIRVYYGLYSKSKSNMLFTLLLFVVFEAQNHSKQWQT